MEEYIERLEWLKEWMEIKTNDLAHLLKVFPNFNSHRKLPPDNLTFWEIGSFEHYCKYKTNVNPHQ